MDPHSAYMTGCELRGSYLGVVSISQIVVTQATDWNALNTKQITSAWVIGEMRRDCCWRT